MVSDRLVPSMRAILVMGLLALLGTASASTSITHAYQGWTTRSPLSGLEPFVICEADGDGYGGACFPNLATNGRATVRIDADAGTTVAGMLWAYDAAGNQLSGDVICVNNHQSYAFRYNTGATEIVVGVGMWLGIGAACASNGAPAGEITVSFA